MIINDQGYAQVEVDGVLQERKIDFVYNDLWHRKRYRDARFSPVPTLLPGERWVATMTGGVIVRDFLPGVPANEPDFIQGP